MTTSHPSRWNSSATSDSPKVCCSPGQGMSRIRRPSSLGLVRLNCPKVALFSLSTFCKRPRPTVTSVKLHMSRSHISPRWRATGDSRSRKMASIGTPRSRRAITQSRTAKSSSCSTSSAKTATSSGVIRWFAVSGWAAHSSGTRWASMRRGMISYSTALASRTDLSPSSLAGIGVAFRSRSSIAGGLGAGADSDAQSSE